MPSFSLAALTVLDLAPPAQIDVGAACGYQQVGLRLLPAMPGGVAYPLMEDEAGLKETLGRRLPPLLNLAGDFREDLPLRSDGPVVAPVPGALAIQEYLARVEWLGRRGDPVAYARHLRRSPLPGLDPAQALVQYALGDRVVPNPTTAALVRAGALGDRTVVVRTDRVVRASGAEWPDPHGFLLAVRAPGLIGRVAMLAQEQVARFLRDEGETLWIPESLSSAGPDSRFLTSDSDF